MKNTYKLLKTLPFLLVMVVAGQSLLAQDETMEALPLKAALGNDFWSHPRFLQSFLGDYGFRTEVEPGVDQAEREVLRKVVSQAPDDLRMAITTLEGQTKENSSAALDFTLATLRFQNGQLTGAAEAYRAAIKKFSNFLRAHKNLGLVLIQQGHYEEASKALLKAISLGENGGIVFVALGYSYFNLEQYASAENAYRAAILRNPKGVEAHNGLVNCLLETERHAEAVAMLDELLRKNPKERFYWLAQTNAYVMLEKPLQAAVNLETLRRKGELDGRGHLLLGDLYYNLELAHLALSVYQDALEAKGNLDPGRFIRVAQILIERQSLQAGFDYLDRIEAKFQGALNENERLAFLAVSAQAALARNDAEAADSFLGSILETNPRDGQALLLRGRYFWKYKNDPVEAAFYFERAAKVDQTQVDALIEHAQMLAEKKKYAEAVKLLERAQILEPQENVGRYLKSVRNLLRAQGG